MRARVGFNPKRPQHDAGIRIEPPPSVACATGTMPAATAAAEPPLEPPGERSSRHGLRVTPYRCDSVEGDSPNSGEFVLPKITSPARRNRATTSLSCAATLPAKRRDAAVVAAPATDATSSLTRNGTPRKGPAGSPAAMPARAASSRRVTTAFSVGCSASLRAIAASSSSVASTSPRRTSSARPSASWPM